MNLSELPEITFATADPAAMDLEIVGAVEALLGRKLERADPLRLFLRGVEAIIIQQRLLIDETARQNLLAFATKGNLDHLGVLVGVERLPAAAASTTVEVTLSAARNKATIIPAGTRVSPGDNVNFALDTDIIFDIGETSRQVGATCTELGAVGNDYAIGEISKIVDPVAFLKSIVNVTVSEGGADVEGDDAFRERIQLAPESFSVAGPAGAYKFFTKQVSPLITDVEVLSEAPCEVSVWALLKGGEIPEQEMLDAIAEHLNGATIRPLTDKVIVKPPEVVSYDIDLRYCVARSDQTSAGAIQAAVETAIQDYIAWQRDRLGRDINPTELYYQIRKAGAKRADILEPKFTATSKYSVAIPNNVNVIFAGLEDD